MSYFETFGLIFSYGYITCGFLPCRVAFPSMAAVIYGTNVNIPNDIMVASFKGYLSSHGSCVLH